MKRYIGLLISVLMFNAVLAQNDASSKLVLTSFVTSDSVMLRWAPTDYSAWQLGNKGGYKVERILVSSKGIVPEGNEITPLHEGIIKPLPEDAWETVVRRDSVWSPIALQALWGETFELSTSFQKNIVEAYNKYKENELRFGFAFMAADRSIVAAKAMGVYFAEKIVDKRNRYIYRVIMCSGDANADTAYTVVNCARPTDIFKPFKPTVVQYDNRILLKYRAIEGDGCIGYYVERSFDGKRYKPASSDIIVPFKEGDFMMAYHSDTIEEGHQNVYYRLKGLSAFGFTGPYSDTVHVRVSKAIESPTYLEGIPLDDGKVRLSWKFEGNSTKLSHFKMLRSDKANGVAVPLADNIPSASRSWIDKAPLSSNYYKVVAVSEMGAEAESLEAFVQLGDSIPPAPPVDLKAEIDTSGIVILKWLANTEPDLYGYKIYRANCAEEPFAEITKNIIEDNTFTDTIAVRLLNKKVLYQLVAVDKRYNMSDYSEIFSFDRPDIIPPVPPVLRSSSLANGIVSISYIPSSSDDVAKVRFYKSNESDSSPEKMVGEGNNTGLFADTLKVTDGIRYVYTAVALDSAGNMSIRSNRIVANAAKKEAEAVIALTGKIVIEDNGKAAIKLNWNPLPTALIYRRVNEGTFELYKTVSEGSIYVDYNVVQGNDYEYMLVSGKSRKNVSFSLK